MIKNNTVLSIICLLFMISFTKAAFAQGGEYHVWVKTSPCSGRFDWITVAKENPTIGGTGFYSPANNVFPGTQCTASGCSFKEATRVANSLRPSPVFSQYCCHDYSVWQESGTGKMTVVVGKLSTAGPGWLLVKGDLCCDEAEDLSGIPGACSSGADVIKPPTVQCYPGSHPQYNKQTKRNECFCNPGLVWNSTKTACVKGVQCYPGSYAATNPQTGQTECYCNPGLVWNSTKTACVTPAVQCYPGSYAATNPQTGQTECYCNPGLVWNSTKTACITATTQCWPGSYAAVNPQTGVTECYCNPGLVWNSTKTACITPTIQCYPGSHVVTNPQTGATECACDAGLVWNSTKTACITGAVQCYPGSYAATNPQTGQTECYCNPGLVWNSTRTACVTSGGNRGGATWTLVSVEGHPDKPAQGWTFNQGGSAHMDVYNGDKADFQWTPPPASFGKEGFTVTVSAQSKPLQNSHLAIIMGVRGRGLTTTAAADDQYIYVKPPEEKASDSKSIKWVPSGTPNEIEVEVGMMWGAVYFVYKYKKQ